MKKILAKSINYSEGLDKSRTLKEHMEDILFVYEVILKDVNLDGKLKRIIKLACLLHDLGKINDIFQKKIEIENLKQDLRFDCITEEKYKHRIKNLNIEDLRKLEIRHNLLSGAFMNELIMLCGSDLENSERNILYKSVLLHHGSFDDYFGIPFSDVQNAIYRDVYEILEQEKYDLLEIEELIRKELDIKEFKLDKEKLDYDFFDKYNESFIEYEKENEVRAKYILIKGFLNLLDHLASYLLENRNLNYYFNDEYLNKLDDVLIDFIKHKSEEQKVDIQEVKFNDIQRNILEAEENDLIITEAFTGKGKTITDDRLKSKRKFYLVPNQISAMSFFLDAEKKYGKNNVGILHGDIHLYAEKDDEEGNTISTENIELARNFSKPYIVATLDQLVLSMFKYKNYEKTFSGIYGSRICLDELHLLSPRMFIIFKYFIEFTNKYFKTKFHLMTATLPKIYGDRIKDLTGLRIYNNTSSLDDNNEKLVRIKTNIGNDNRDVIEIIKKLLKSEKKDIKGDIIKNRILIVKNTVESLQELYQDLIQEIDDKYKEKVNCLHSRFKFDDKRYKYKDILKDEKSKYDIWICTQSVEIALDIDFPYIITDLSPLDSIIQRMGRCNRKNKLEYGEVFILKNSKDVYNNKLKKVTDTLLKKYGNKKEFLNMYYRKALLDNYYLDEDVNKFYLREFEDAEKDIRYIYGISDNEEINGEKLMFNYEPYRNLVNNKKEASRLFRNVDTNIKIYLEEDYNKFKEGIRNALENNDSESISKMNLMLRKNSLQISVYKFKKLYNNGYIKKYGNKFILSNSKSNVYEYNDKIGLKLNINSINDYHFDVADKFF